MRDKEWKKKKKIVKDIFDKWIEIMGLRWYEITMEWKAGDGGEDPKDGFTRCMDVRSRWEYRTATVRIWLEELPDPTDPKVSWKLETMIIHELVHIFLQPLRHENYDWEKEEYVVQSLALAFGWARDEGRSNKKKKKKK